MTPGLMLHRIVSALATKRMLTRESQATIAGKIGITRQSFARWEDATAWPTVENLVKWAAALGMDLVVTNRDEAAVECLATIAPEHAVLTGEAA